jgi:hypothetical protein
MRQTYWILLGSLAACGPQGNPTAERAADRAELLRLHELQRTAHLEERADLLVAPMADTVVNVGRGVVAVESRGASQRQFQAYFDQVTFQEWSDVAPPVIRISAGGTMAYVIVQKRVRLTAPDSAGTPRAEHTLFAWLEIYEKQRGRWTMTTIASTDQPGPA